MSLNTTSTAAVPTSFDQKFPVLPDYRGACLSNVVPALLSPPGICDWLPAPVAEAKQVVLLLVDGMGWQQLQERAHLTPTLMAMQGGAITTVAPTTTTTALTSLVTGVPPGEHGLIGYQVYVAGQLLNTLRWTIGRSGQDARKSILPEQMQTLPAFLGQRVPAVGRSEFSGSGFTRAYLDGVPHVGYQLNSTMAVATQRLVLDGAPLVYVYYDGPDRIAHEYGLAEHLDAEYVAVDQLVAQMLSLLPSSVALLVVADHGQVHVGDNKIVLSGEVLGLTSVTSGEARFRWLHARPGRAQALLEVAKANYERYGLVATVEQVLDEGWFGPNVSPQARQRMGDVALVPQEPVAFLVPASKKRSNKKKFELIGRHGSLTSAEVLVPCLGAFGVCG
ncbi:MAG: alkaline phosphatase family protein [Acidimicrobiia bacterium]|nr:alkaline phosphatase family protein [Acidimicrobiia bacterium]MYC56995.1 alkaline phosphatase family protein [Acidimicrobiia bacterium]MYG94073.1 alkaline phosphatase family protein [Acidimicrobiia bacterium]MYI30860.1 alkaline phosphatase family protein [Acidimicrobiia bacterium]